MARSNGEKGCCAVTSFAPIVYIDAVASETSQYVTSREQTLREYEDRQCRPTLLQGRASLPGPIDGLLCAIVRPADKQASEGAHRVGRYCSELMANGADVIGLDSKVTIWSAVSQYISAHRCVARAQKSTSATSA